MENDMTICFKRSLYQAVIRFKREKPGALEARTKQREAATKDYKLVTMPAERREQYGA